MNNNKRGFRGYLIFMFLVVALVVVLNLLRYNSSPYTYDQFIADMDEGKTTEITIVTDEGSGAGYVSAGFDTGSNKRLY